jgi:hypothetical protein
LDADDFFVILRVAALAVGAVLIIFSLYELQGAWAALSGLGLVMFLFALISK